MDAVEQVGGFGCVVEGVRAGGGDLDFLVAFAGEEDDVAGVG